MLAAAAERLDPAVRELIAAAAEEARAACIEVWLVGGLVRDLLLERPTRDVDLVLEGDAAELAERLGGRLEAPVRRHARFRTAHLAWNGVEVDVVSARRESYPAPAALPRIEPGTLRDDLERRDFTVNALAAPLVPFPGGDIVDPMDGRRDLARRRLQVHHPCSFEDDPTRVFRGVELEARLGFVLGPETERLARDAVAGGHLTALSGARLREAWRRALESPARLREKVERLDALGVLRSVGLAGGSARVAESLERLTATLPRVRAARVDLPPVGDLVHLGLLGGREEAERTIGALGLTGGPAARLASWPERAEAAARRLGEAITAYAAETAVEELDDGELLVLACRLRGGPAASALDVLLRRRPFRLSISGDDLLRRGVPPGRALGEALEATRRARLDGALPVEEELEFALRRVRADGGVA